MPERVSSAARGASDDPHAQQLRGLRATVINWRDLGHGLAGGSERYAWEFARGLDEGGARVEFLTARDSHQAARETIDGISVRRGGGQFTFYALVWLRLILQRLRGRSPDIVFDAENGIPVFSPLLLPRRTAVVLVMHHVHQEQFLTYFPRPLAHLGRWLERWLMPRVYRNVKTVAVSDSTVREMRVQLDWSRDVEILANGADMPSFEQPAEIHDRSEPGRITVLGRLATHKRIDLVIRAVAQVRDRNPQLREVLRLDVVGKGPVLDQLTAVVDELGLQGVVALHGYLDEQTKRDVIAKSRLHVCASDAEGWGQVVIEAAGLGVPTLSRDVAGLRDSVRDGVTGWLVENPVAVPTTSAQAKALVDVLAEGVVAALAELDDPRRRETMGAAARQWARGFTWAGMRSRARQIVVDDLAHRRG
ncbi:glycosyltransferase family 4 protein [Nocardioides sp. Root151]|uniref:glycosyltransferase family 4 protein n=1 Tax=Nocardioides sp. Root151 TaxID=1736475 RepID=UPI0007030268|nr:glycosyltransferase family 4 protein [Nocardioides sp. Root151]KQZ69961.1 hypothetical protein ASD66_09725 [Nocardioides sp. Root151]